MTAIESAIALLEQRPKVPSSGDIVETAAAEE